MRSAEALLVLLLGACTPEPTARLWLGGDLTWGGDDPTPLLAPLAPLVDGAVGIVNVEGPVAVVSLEMPAFTADGERYILRNDPRGLRALRAAGIVAAGVENNHRLDAGDPAATDAALRAASIEALGDTRIDVSGVSIALAQVDLSAGVPPGLRERLAGIGTGADALVVGFHVVGPPSYLPRPELREAVDLAVEAGAAVVVAHGTHAIGPVERRGDAVIAWGLGNLAMTCPCTTQSEALLLRVDLPRGGRPTAAVHPLTAGLGGAAAAPSGDTPGIYRLLGAIGSTPLSFDAGGVGWIP